MTNDDIKQLKFSVKYEADLSTTITSSKLLPKIQAQDQFLGPNIYLKIKYAAPSRISLSRTHYASWYEYHISFSFSFLTSNQFEY